MNKYTRALLGAVLVAAALVAPSAGTATAAESESVALRKPFTRELVRFGQRDRSPYDIEHVRELQIRLKRVGTLRTNPNGKFGTATRAAVRRFQKRQGLRQTGVAGVATWRKLLQRSNNNVRTAKRRCAGSGWHVCYDRRNHQVTLWRSGRMWNTWLVRGGMRSAQTRTGDFTVFRRDKDHVSGLYGSPMPYSQFFSGGQALHGSRYMMDPYKGHSHGCVNMYVEDSRQLWNLTHDKRLRVHVYGAWS